MKNLIICVLASYILLGNLSLRAEEKIILRGQVFAAITKRPLTNAYVLLYDKEGNVVDSIRANKGFTYSLGEIDTLSYYGIEVPRVDSTFVFDVVCEGYAPHTVAYTLDKIGKRETSRNIPAVYLNKAVKLNEITVETSKIKFYNKGDTIVYDATAFQVAEGSMLDALIAQLPGVELSPDGQIKVNGEYVESLLLDGKKFFDSNNNLMLENIAAYTVKDIKVYEGVSKENEIRGRTQTKELTMDVRLKKEYNIGWLLNTQAGYGTENRYLGRVFAAWFNPQWRVSLIGNINNLNDNRTPGRNDTWTPEQMPSGRQRNATVGLEYNYQKRDNRFDMAQGSILFRHSNSDRETRTDRTNFLTGGNTFDKSFSNDYNRSTSVSTQHFVYLNRKKMGYLLQLSGNYIDSRTTANALSGSFYENQDTMSYKTLDAIYSLGSANLLETIINRSKTQADGRTKSYSVYINPSISYSIPKSNDMFQFGFGMDYTSNKNEVWKDYEVNFGPTTDNSEKLRQYFDNTPNYSKGFSGDISYNLNTPSIQALFAYGYNFKDDVKDSYMYALDRLNDMGIYGTLPSSYLTSFDPNNSYKSRLLTNNHALYMNVSWYYTPDDKKYSWMAVFAPRLSLTNRHFNYWRNEKDYHLSKTNFIMNVNGWYAGQIRYRFRRRGEEGSTALFTNTLLYNYQMQPTLPDMFDMVDVINDSDPLNIYYGNTNLKTQIYQRHRLQWNWVAFPHSFNNTFSINYWYTTNALTRGYTYNTSNGVRYNRMYNVDGNRSLMLTDEFKWQFGTKRQFTLDSYSEVEFSRYTDMIGVNLELPEETHVNNRRLTQNLKLSWQVGNTTLGVRCDVSNRYTTSTQNDFSTLNATHVTSGATATIGLPKGFSLNTDFMLYTRRGYGSKQLDTTDPVWNVRFSYCPPSNTRWVVMLDGYDMLHTLSNVSYAVTASGRTVSYTNVLPRYFLLSIQYRLNIQPKRN